MMMQGPGNQSFRRIAGTIASVVAAALIAVPVASGASTPFTDIHSSGPLSDIYIGNDLSCQVRSGGFSSTEFFPNAPGPGDCGTFLFINADGNSGFLGPDFANHAGGTHTTGQFSSTEMPFTPVSQSLSGSGTTTSPYRVTTVVSGVDGTLSLTFTEVDTYIVGNNFFQTDVTVSNESAQASFTGELRTPRPSPPARPTSWEIRHPRSKSSCRSPPMTVGSRRQFRRSGPT